MSENSFAVVCDSGCDLPSGYLEKIGVTVVPLYIEVEGQRYRDLEGCSGERAYADLAEARSVEAVSPTVDDFLAAYRSLAESGVRRILSVHSVDLFTDVHETAHAAARILGDEVTVEFVDTGVASLATGFVVDRVAALASAGVSFEDAKAAARQLSFGARLLVIPGSGARLPRHRSRRRQRSVVERAVSLRYGQHSGCRALFLLDEGELTEMARSADFDDLAKRAARAMSAISAEVGPIVYAEVEAGDSRALRVVDKLLDEEEFPSSYLGAMRATPAVASIVGVGAVAIAMAPAEQYDSISKRFSVPTISSAVASYASE